MCVFLVNIFQVTHTCDVYIYIHIYIHIVTEFLSDAGLLTGLGFQAMISSCTQSQFCTATPISSFVQCSDFNSAIIVTTVVTIVILHR